MKLGLSKTIVYPLMIVSLTVVIAIAVYAFLNSIGARMNPAQPAFAFEDSISFGTLWLDQEKGWQFNSSSRLAVFDAGNERFAEGGSTLESQAAEAFGDVVFLVVRESLDKEKAKSLLRLLSAFELKKVYVASPFDDTMSALKKLEPRFWYAASPRSWVKWSLFSTFGIEKAFTLDADFLFVDKEISKLLSEKLKAEIERRKIPVIKAKENGIAF